MNELTKQGVSIIMISSELPEIINMADRVYVMYEGRVTGCIPYQEVKPGGHHETGHARSIRRARQWLRDWEKASNGILRTIWGISARWRL